MVTRPCTFTDTAFDVPSCIQLETTSRCNLNCKTCLKPYFLDQWQEEDMDFDLFIAIIDQLPGESLIHLQGWGEPLLHTDTLKHISCIKERGLHVSLTSNGTLLDYPTAKEYLKVGLDGITFSMAGNSVGVQDVLRGRGTSGKVHEAIAMIAEARRQSRDSTLELGVSYLVTAETVEEIPEAITWCRKNDVDLFATIHLTQVANDEQQALRFHLPLALPFKYRGLRLQSRLRSLFGKMRLKLAPFSTELTPVCDKNPLHNIFINVRGEVSPCVFLSTPVRGGITWHHEGCVKKSENLIFGNLRDNSLEEIWKSAPYVFFRDAYRRRLHFHDSLLSKVSYSIAGAQELKRAIRHIESYFADHPPPAGCENCYKLDGF